MAKTLDPERIVDRSETLIEDGSGRGETFLDALEAELDAADIPGGCSWEVCEVKHAGYEPSLLIRVQRLPDLRVYVSARDYGVHLQVSRIITIEPGWLKRTFAEKTYGDPLALSIPGDVRGKQDLSAFVAVVQHCVKTAAEPLVEKRSRGQARIRRNS
jgi:hypothetical protein